LSDEGAVVMGKVAAPLAEPLTLQAEVSETDDLGLWVRIVREDGDHLVLVRWDFVLSLDFRQDEPTPIGLGG
jgi:hypothetical protein